MDSRLRGQSTPRLGQKGSGERHSHDTNMFVGSTPRLRKKGLGNSCPRPRPSPRTCARGSGHAQTLCGTAMGNRPRHHGPSRRLGQASGLQHSGLGAYEGPRKNIGAFGGPSFPPSMLVQYEGCFPRALFSKARGAAHEHVGVMGVALPRALLFKARGAFAAKAGIHPLPLSMGCR